MPSGIPDKDNRVPWEDPIPGEHPAFATLSKKEAEKLALAAIEEAKRFTDGPGMQFASEGQKFIADAERRRQHHQASVDLFVTLGNKDEERKHREWLSEAHLDLGQFDEARACLIGAGGEPINRELYDYIGEISLACYRPDNEECDCEREKDTIEIGGQTKEIELDRRFAVRPIFSPFHNQVVTIYRCRHCGFLNAMSEAPARQAEYEIKRRQIEAQTRAGQAVTVNGADVHTLKAS